MHLKPGDAAPPFEVRDVQGKTVRLGDFLGSKVLLCFYRYAGCPYCNLYLHEIIGRHEEYRKLGLRIVAFFQSRTESILHFPAKQHPPFPLVPDPDRIVYDRYGVESSASGMFLSALHIGTFVEAHLKGFIQGAVDGDFFLMPAEFLIGENGRVRTAHYAQHLADRLSFAEIMDFLTAK